MMNKLKKAFQPKGYFHIQTGEISLTYISGDYTAISKIEYNGGKTIKITSTNPHNAHTYSKICTGRQLKGAMVDILAVLKMYGIGMKEVPITFKTRQYNIGKYYEDYYAVSDTDSDTDSDEDIDRPLRTITKPKRQFYHL